MIILLLITVLISQAFVFLLLLILLKDSMKNFNDIYIRVAPIKSSLDFLKERLNKMSSDYSEAFGHPLDKN